MPATLAPTSGRSPASPAMVATISRSDAHRLHRAAARHAIGRKHAHEGQALPGGRLASVEQTLRALPTKEDMHQLHLAMKEMQGEMKTTAAVMEGNNKIMSRLEGIVAAMKIIFLTEG